MQNCAVEWYFIICNNTNWEEKPLWGLEFGKIISAADQGMTKCSVFNNIRKVACAFFSSKWRKRCCGVSEDLPSILFEKWWDISTTYLLHQLQASSLDISHSWTLGGEVPFCEHRTVVKAWKYDSFWFCGRIKLWWWWIQQLWKQLPYPSLGKSRRKYIYSESVSLSI